MKVAAFLFKGKRMDKRNLNLIDAKISIRKLLEEEAAKNKEAAFDKAAKEFYQIEETESRGARLFLEELKREELRKING